MLPVDLSDDTLRTSIQQKDWQIVRQARLAGKPWEMLVTQEGYRALHWAILQGEMGAVRRLLEQEAPVGPYRIQGQPQSPLWSALLTRQDEMACLLLDAGADPWEPRPGHPGELPLTGASEVRLTQATQSLLAREPALYLFPLDQQLRVIHSWVGAMALPESAPARQVLEQILSSGWVPPFQEHDWTTLVAYAHEVIERSSPPAQEFLHSFLAYWRQVDLAQHPASKGAPRVRI